MNRALPVDYWSDDGRCTVMTLILSGNPIVARTGLAGDMLAATAAS
jgi:hypothetical protein